MSGKGQKPTVLLFYFCAIASGLLLVPTSYPTHLAPAEGGGDSHYCDSMPQAEQLAFNELSHRKWPTSLFLKVTFIISRIILILFEGFLAMMC